MDTDLLGTYDDCTAYIKELGKREKIVANYPADSGKKIIVKTDKGIYEFEICWEGSDSEALLKLVADGAWSEKHIDPVMTFVGVNKPTIITVPDLDVLYMLKMSHRYRKDSPHFLKTMRDIQLMRKMGAKMPVQYSEWFKLREKNTYQNTLPKLNQSKKDFFDNSSSIYTLDHDSIHEAVKHFDRPAYEYFKPDAAEVMTSKSMFFACSREVQLYAALEEVMVLSIERSIHPFNLTGDKLRWAFNMAHMKLATSISSGWFREFVWENYDEVQGMYSEYYVNNFYRALGAGEIKPFEG
jgi:hypothetical protein